MRIPCPHCFKYVPLVDVKTVPAPAPVTVPATVTESTTDQFDIYSTPIGAPEPVPQPQPEPEPDPVPAGIYLGEVFNAGLWYEVTRKSRHVVIPDDDLRFQHCYMRAASGGARPTR